MADPGRGLTERVVTARGRRFRTVDAGTGEPLVVFESGLGAGASLWADVQRRVAAHTSTMSYDRAGYVGSQRARDGRLLTDINLDLEAILDAIGHDGPILLVGQSWGGPIVRSMAHHTGRPLAGVVLVDGTNSHVINATVGKPLQLFFGLLGKASWVGLHRTWRRKLLDGITAGLDKDDSDRVLKDMLRGSSSRAGAAEAKGLLAECEADGLAALEAKGFPVGIPVVLLTATLSKPAAAENLGRFIESQTQEAQRLGARQVVVATSMHDIHMQEPGIVADEILAIVTGHSRPTEEVG